MLNTNNIKAMKKVLYLLLTIPLLFTSCSKDDDSTTSGCMDPLAINYDELATVDDGSCENAYDNIVGLWAISDYLIGGESIFCPSGAASTCIENMTTTFDNDNTSITSTFYGDNSFLTVNGTWLLTTNNNLEMINEDGDLVDWTIVKITTTEVEMHATLDLGGISYNAIITGTKYTEGK